MNEKRSEERLERIATNAERAASLDEQERLLVLLVLNGHLTTGKEKGKCTTD